jgi:S-adenosyl methyltransferase
MIGGMPDSASSTEPASPPGIDIRVANIARVYDYWLDGKDNLTDPDVVLGDPVTASVLDLEEPMGIIVGSVGHFFEPSRMRSLIGMYLSRARPGSWLVISLGRAEDTQPMQTLQPAYTAARTYRYSLEDYESLFTGTEILPPGLREAKAWVTGTSGPVPAAGLFMHCGVGVKR